MMPTTGGGLGMAPVPSLAVLDALARYSAALLACNRTGAAGDWAAYEIALRAIAVATDELDQAILSEMDGAV